MAKYTFNCSDAGMNCGFQVSDRSRDRLMGKIVEHAKHVHNILEIGPDLQKKLDDAIRKKGI